MKTLNTGVSKYKNSDGQWVYIPCLTGIQGEKGEQGNPGEGVPTGGTSGQILAKNTNNDYDTHWINLPITGGGSSVTIDNTLTQSGAAADAKATGDKINEVKQSIPTALKNPKALTFTGAVTAEYDGSSAVTINLSQLSEEIADKATLENGVIKFWKTSTEESGTDTLLYSVDISSIGGTGGLDLENLTLSVSQVGNYQRLSMSDGTTTKNVDIPITTITDEQVQNAVNNYMAANPIDETDPTVPDWAKKEFGSGLIVTEDGRLSVDTVNTVEENNMKPITSDAVYKVIGNIETALAAI